MKIEMHPSLDDYDPLSPEELSRLRASIKKSGCFQPVLIWQNNGHQWLMDGRHRWTIGNELKVTVGMRIINGTEEEAVALAAEMNDARRHRTEEHRLARIERVKEARKLGLSTRAIAEKEKTSQTQTRRDLASGEPGGGSTEEKPPENQEEKAEEKTPTVTGSDGKRYKQKRTLAAGGKRKKKPPRPADKDATGREIPPHLRDVFGDCSLGDLAASLPGAVRIIKSAGMWNNWLKLEPSVTAAETLHETLDRSLPYAVCPVCEGVQGEECQKGVGCEGRSWVPKWKFEEIQIELGE